MKLCKSHIHRLHVCLKYTVHELYYCFLFFFFVHQMFYSSVSQACDEMNSQARGGGARKYRE